MKLIHLCLLTILFSTSSPSVAQSHRFGGTIQHGSSLKAPTSKSAFRWFRPVANAETIFRGQSDGVPLPPGASIPNGSTGGIAIPADGAITMPSTPQMGIGAPVMNPDGSFTQPMGVTPAGGFMPQTVQANPGFQAPVAPESSTWNAFSPPIGTDPFLSGPQQFQQPYGAYPGMAPMQPFATYGAQGPSPFRTGLHQSLDFEWAPTIRVDGANTGNFEQYGVDYTLGYTGSFMPGWMYTWNNEFRYRGYDGPNGTPGLPGSAFRFGFDFELESVAAGPISLKLGISPSLNTDLDASIDSDAFQLDGRGLILFQLSPAWTAVLGAGYWDRVDDRVIPYVGVVYRDDFWQWKLMFPESEISLFVGNEALGSKWIYVRAEYHVEAYHVRTGPGGRDNVELEDTRLMLGFRMDGGTYQWFTEGGWIFDREVDFESSGSFQPETGFLLRMGWKY